MINEDYCFYEVAKLLKEKGFDWDCITYYVDSEPNGVKYSMLFENNNTWEDRCCSAPTHQMAIKWLREEKNIIVNVWYNGADWNAEYYNDEVDNFYIIADCLSNSYEETVEAALKYTLENLI